jgi:transcriptional regulator with PAS, ATPase and Fis domain
VELFRRLGEVYLALDRIDEAESSLTRAFELSHYLHDKYELGTILRTHGLIASYKRDLNLSRSYFQEAITTLKVIQEPFELARTYRVSAGIFMEWIECRGISSEIRDQLICEAKEHLLEAVHLFSSHGLYKRAKGCKKLLSQIDRKSRNLGIAPPCSHIQFDNKWLIGGMLVAKSRHMQDVVDRIEHIAPSKMPVLISGETGTGKEIVARLLHNFSDRAKGPFVAVNCAAVPGTVFESEFFGHRRGSFTGALRDRVGLIEQASDGTLFIDEISELTGEQQAKLLRALQEEKIRRIGENIERPVDIRCISASNIKIQDLLSSGKLREDFYYRIHGEEIHLEPLSTPLRNYNDV